MTVNGIVFSDSDQISSDFFFVAADQTAFVLFILSAESGDGLRAGGG